VLWDPAAHEPLADAAWDPDQALAAVRAIVADTEDAFDGGWPPHPEDQLPNDPGPWADVYCGGAGVVDALRRLAGRGLVELRRDYRPYLELLQPGGPRSSLFVGETGMLLVRHRLGAPVVERLREAIASDEGVADLITGSPGALLAARELGFDDLRHEIADTLRATTWPNALGPAHGFAGCVLALGEVEGAGETARRHAIVENGLANWPPLADGELVCNDTTRVQWCHGAPGMITSLGDQLDEDLALAGGELTWRAGPLAKGGGLCHGTAGNGYAFLELFRRTADERWLERARAFAMHASTQVSGRYSLWSGDLGIALYLADCVDGAGALPLP